MIPLLAQTSPSDFSDLGHFVRNAVEIGGIAYLIYKAAKGDRTKVGPLPFPVELKREFATKEELRSHREENIREQNKLEQRMTHIERKMDEDKNEILKAGEDRVIKLHNRINEILQGVSELRGEIKGRFERQ
jgi:predicted transcriptional regulator